MQIRLEEIDENCPEDQLFLYDILKYRWLKSETINIEYKAPSSLPSFESHKQFLQKKPYKKFYKIFLCDILIGSSYVDYNNVYGTFLLPTLIKKALKSNPRTTKKTSSLTTLIAHEVMKNNLDIVNFYAGINSKNTLSENAAKELNGELVEVVYRIPNIFIDNEKSI